METSLPLTSSLEKLSEVTYELVSQTFNTSEISGLTILTLLLHDILDAVSMLSFDPARKVLLPLL